MHIGRYFNLDIYLDWSVAILMLLLSMSFASSASTVFPETNSVLVTLSSILFAGLILFSIFAHEMSHIIAGRQFGVGFSSIRFFIFGGQAGMTTLPPTPKSEFVMAIAGPLMSLALAAVGYLIYYLMPFGLWAKLIYNLSHLNLVLGIFNMLPMFPTDGGRCLRAIVWHRSGSFVKGTSVASSVGRFGGHAFIACGVLMALGVSVPYFGSGIGNGIWIGVLGWLISSWADQEMKAVLYHKLNQNE